MLKNTEKASIYEHYIKESPQYITAKAIPKETTESEAIRKMKYQHAVTQTEMDIALMNQHADEHCTKFSALDNEKMTLIKEKYNNEVLVYSFRKYGNRK